MTNDEIRALREKSTAVPWPESYVQGAVRHINKNVDRDAFWSPDEGQPDFWWDRHHGAGLGVLVRLLRETLHRQDRRERRS